MFKFFKNKIKTALDKFSKEVDVNAEVEPGSNETEADILEEANEEKEIIEEESQEEEIKKEKVKKAKEKRGLFSKIFAKKNDEPTDDEENVEKSDFAPTVNEVEDAEDPKLKEEEIEIPDVPTEDLSEEDVELLSDKVRKTIEQATQAGKNLGIGKKKTKAQEAIETRKEEKSTLKKTITPEKKGFLKKISDSITKKVLSEHAFNELFWELEITLLENNVAVEVIDLIKENLKTELVNVPIQRKDIAGNIEKTLKSTLEEVFNIETPDLINLMAKKKPFTILIVGVNGSGKTTTIAKLVKYLQNHKKSTVLAAADTFRAAAIDQLQEHADNLGVKLIKHDYNSDPAAVAFDAVRYAESKKLDSVIIDTAGRLHSNANLMDELKKVYRVSKPDFTIFLGESITGNDCIEQAKEFQKVVEFDGIILSKADVDEKGGTAISISYVTQKPILFLGVGQNYEDLETFDKYKIMYRMFDTELED